MSSTRGRFEYLEGRRISKIILLTLPFIIAILSFTALHAEDKTKTVIGAVEEVILLPWGVKLRAHRYRGRNDVSGCPRSDCKE